MKNKSYSRSPSFTNHDRREFIGTAMAICGGFALMNACGHAEAKKGKDNTPAVPIPVRSILMRSPESALFGVTPDETVEITLAEVIKCHGFCAGGGTFSFRAAQEAFAVLYGKSLPTRRKIQVYTSHHCCQAFALAYITGARTNYGAYGSHGDLILLPEDEKKIVFIDKLGGRSVTLRPLFNPHDTFSPLFQKTLKDPGIAPQVHKVLNEKIEEYLTAPTEKLFIIEE